MVEGRNVSGNHIKGVDKEVEYEAPGHKSVKYAGYRPRLEDGDGEKRADPDGNSLGDFPEVQLALTA